MKVDILAIGVHPDDVELSCSGTIMKMIADGKSVAIADLTHGELGTRGSAELRLQEAAAAAGIMGVKHRVNAGIPDGFFRNDEESQRAVIRILRQFRPEVVIANAVSDRHPDHGRASALVRDAVFLSGLSRIETVDESGKPQEAWRPKRLFYYIQDRLMMPHFVVDITPYYNRKMDSIFAYGSQFYQPGMEGPQTYISSEGFLRFVEARAREMGHLIGADFGEGFLSDTPLRGNELMSL